MSRAVVVTGIGAVTAVGDTATETWAALCQRTSGADTISQFEPHEAELHSAIACEVDRTLSSHPLVDEYTMGRYAQFAVVAAEEAIADAGLTPDDTAWNTRRVGTSIASALGGLAEIESAAGDRPSTRFLITALSNLASGHVSMTFDARGPNRAPATACASGAHAIADAVSDIRDGRADVVIAGGAESPVSPLGVGSFDAMRALSTRNDDPTAASRPFDADRDGFVIGEGSGVLILESREHAEKRGATIYAEVAGYGLTGDAHHPTRPADEGKGLQRCLHRALDDAGRDPTAVDSINAHGTSTPTGDALEATALREVFGESPPATSVKGTLGHTLGAAGAIEALLVAKSLHSGTIPPTINYQTPDPECSIPIVTEARDVDLDVAVSNSAGFGGTNGVLVFESV